MISEIQQQVFAESCAEGSTAVSFSFSVVFRVTSELPVASLTSGSISAKVLPRSVSHLKAPFLMLIDFLHQILRSASQGPPGPQALFAALH